MKRFERISYAISCICRNCGVKQRISALKGTLIAEKPCKRCGCLALISNNVMQNPPTADEFLFRVEDAAKYLGLHANTIRRWADKGLLPCIRLGKGKRRDRRFRKQDLIDLVARM